MVLEIYQNLSSPEICPYECNITLFVNRWHKHLVHTYMQSMNPCCFFGAVFGAKEETSTTSSCECLQGGRRELADAWLKYWVTWSNTSQRFMKVIVVAPRTNRGWMMSSFTTPSGDGLAFFQRQDGTWTVTSPQLGGIVASKIAGHFRWNSETSFTERLVV